MKRYRSVCWRSALCTVAVVPLLLGALSVRTVQGSVERPALEAPGEIAPAIHFSSASAEDSLRVRLSFAERLHVSWARATIIRTLGDDVLDIIVVSPETTVADLEKAVRMLVSSYETTEVPLRDEVRGHVSATTQPPEESELLTELTRSLESVREGEGFEIRDFGTLPTVVVDLPVEVEWPDFDG